MQDLAEKDSDRIYEFRGNTRLKKANRWGTIDK